MSREKLMASFVVKSIRLSTTLLLSLSRDFVTACCIFATANVCPSPRTTNLKERADNKSNMSDDSSTSSAEQSVKEEKEEEITDLSNR